MREKVFVATKFGLGYNSETGAPDMSLLSVRLMSSVGQAV